MGFKLKFDDITQIALRRKLQKDGESQQFMTNEIARISDDYIPMKSGDLKNIKTVSAHQIHYKSPYAKKQYYTNAGATGGHRGKEWCNRAIIDHKEELIESVAKFCGGKAK